VFAPLAIELLKRGGKNPLRRGSLAIYAVSVIAMLLASGALHAVDPTTELRGILARIDHSAIFILIAGTYTPVHVIQFKGYWRWGMLGMIWAAAMSGMILKLLFFTQIPNWVGLSIYLGLGWMGLISATALYRMVGFRPLLPLIAGAAFYTTGALLDFLNVPVLKTGVFAAHETFHLFVLAGVASHWLYIRRITVSAPVTDLYATPTACSLTTPSILAHRAQQHVPQAASRPDHGGLSARAPSGGRRDSG